MSELALSEAVRPSRRVDMVSTSWNDLVTHIRALADVGSVLEGLAPAQA